MVLDGYEIFLKIIFTNTILTLTALSEKKNTDTDTATVMVFLDAIFQSQFCFLGASNRILCLHAYLNDWPYIYFCIPSSNPADSSP